ncbi:protein adenylyltransferase SelO [Salipiger mucosus]|uniref:Protein nucleotidyltransferase YdiU n=1 Tax=Salipiger mucosus DSM 16094 TaxID=1123237 RepID=S9QAR5_9RHOB|nr:YdiU family protein [Salipiger mucosus]EPX78466.1 Selenoprotein O and cysteine-containing-like protein [Salipiger mucosus DSM 16094]
MTLQIPFDNSYARLPDGFYARLAPTPVSAPRLIAVNESLAELLGVGTAEAAELASVFAGNEVPQGAEPLAQIYAGHQFGSFNPQLGDGRAHLLGEVVGRDGKRRDIQLKGSGRTPFSRGGDGRAWLGPVLREYVVSEAMHALGVPTTRALAAVRTGDDVLREAPLPGAVLTRVAASHIRVGTFQLFASRRQYDDLKRLFDYTVQRHYPEATTPAELLSQVCERQAMLVAQWLSLGFIHGVMNTDNCTLSGETIDYGPCAFMDAFDPDQVYSSIDRWGRYGYSAQAEIVVWNMAQLATALVPLTEDHDRAVEEFTEIVHAMPDLIRAEWLRRFAAKIGIAEPRPEDAQLVGDLLAAMHANQADFTNTFRALPAGTARDQFTDRAAFDAWEARWRSRIAEEPDPEGLMRSVNPAFIPRNHRIEQMIAAAVDGDDRPFHHLNAVLSCPYDDQPEAEELQRPPLPDEVVPATFCGT